MEFIKFSDVTRTYVSGDSEIKALDNVSFDIQEGKFTVILGPSGSGKSTTLNLLGGMDKVSDGTIRVGDKVITSFNDEELTLYRRNDIGFVFQFYNLIPNLTAYENVDISSRLSKSPISAEKALEAVGLMQRKNNFPSQLSGGELQRVSIARALCKNPKLMLCDEPTGALDSETGRKILTLLYSMSKEYNNTVIVVTHNAAIAPAADRVIKLKDGKLDEIIDNKNPILMGKVVW